jgi:manganese-dependent ADP-ribose/CDP-alcohol diphosphatase
LSTSAVIIIDAIQNNVSFNLIFIEFGFTTFLHCSSMRISITRLWHFGLFSVILQIHSVTSFLMRPEMSTTHHHRQPRLNSESEASHAEHIFKEQQTDSTTELHNDSSLAAAADDAPLYFSIGIIADIQYAPIEDGHSFSGNPRFYRHALEVAKHAFEKFQESQVDLVLNLGDIVDGKCQNLAKWGGDKLREDVDPGHYSIDHVLKALSAYTNGPVLHTYGNHCLYNMNRKELGEKLGLPFVIEPCGELAGYFYHVHKGVRFVIIDSYDVAIMQRREQSSEKYIQATEYLSKNNPNFPENMNSPEGLDGLERRFVGFNGAVGKVQLSWLRNTLVEAQKSNEKVIIISHQPIIPNSSNPVCLIWNYDEVLSILREHSDIVIASFSGHAHQGGYVRDPESGIHFRVFEAALENRPEKTYATVDVYSNQVVVRGEGNCESAVYDF